MVIPAGSGLVAVARRDPVILRSRVALSHLRRLGPHVPTLGIDAPARNTINWLVGAGAWRLDDLEY